MRRAAAHHRAEIPDPRFWFGVFLPTAGIILGALVLCISWSGQLPSTVAQKWDWSTQEVITIGPLWLGVCSLVVPSVAALIVLALMKRSGNLTGWGRRLSIVTLTSVAVFTAASLPAMLSGQVGLTDPRLAPDPRAMVGLIGAASLAYGILAALIAGGRPLEDTSAHATPTPPWTSPRTNSPRGPRQRQPGCACSPEEYPG